jgi:hypothetical protein
MTSRGPLQARLADLEPRSRRLARLPGRCHPLPKCADHPGYQRQYTDCHGNLGAQIRIQMEGPHYAPGVDEARSSRRAHDISKQTQHSHSQVLRH